MEGKSDKKVEDFGPTSDKWLTRTLLGITMAMFRMVEPRRVTGYFKVVIQPT
jgi:hypothetical protein